MKTLALLVLALLVAYVAIFNPWNFFVPQSERFDLGKFLAIEKGDRLEHVTEELGEPTYIRRISRADCQSCRLIYFAGPAPDWLVGSLSANVIVDEKDVVVSQLIIEEP